MTKTGIIYMWKCLDTNKAYIGQTVNPRLRFKNHILNGLSKESNHPLYKDMFIYNNWEYIILEKNIQRGEDLNNKELYYIDKFNTMYPNGYNLRYGASFSGKTINYSEHHKQALKDSWTEERKIKASITQKIAQKNYWNSIEGKQKAKHHSEVMIGKKTSEETKQKQIESRKRYYAEHGISEETRNKLSKANKGRKHTDITKKHMSDAHKGKSPGNKGKHLVWDNKELKIFHYE